MPRNLSTLARLSAVLLGVVAIYSPKAYSEFLTLVGQVPIDYGSASQILFSPSGDKAIIKWPNPQRTGATAWVVDKSSEIMTTTELNGPQAIWGADGPIVISNGNGPSDDSLRTQFNIDESQIGTKDGGITLIDENGTVLIPDWHSRPIQGAGVKNLL